MTIRSRRYKTGLVPNVSLAPNVAKSVFTSAVSNANFKLGGLPKRKKNGKEKREAFASAHTSDKELQANNSISLHASSIIAKAKTWHKTCFSLSFVYLILNQSIFFFDVQLVLTLLLCLVLTFPNVPSLEHRHWSKSNT